MRNPQDTRYWLTAVSDISSISLETRLGTVAQAVCCVECERALEHRIKRIQVEWSLVRVRSLLFRDHDGLLTRMTEYDLNVVRCANIDSYHLLNVYIIAVCKLVFYALSSCPEDTCSCIARFLPCIIVIQYAVPQLTNLSHDYELLFVQLVTLLKQITVTNMSATEYHQITLLARVGYDSAAIVRSGWRRWPYRLSAFCTARGY